MSPAKIIGYALTAAYPFLVFLTAAVFNLPPKTTGLIVVAVAAVLFFIGKGKSRLAPLVMCVLALLMTVTRREIFLFVYPVAINILLCVVFAASLRKNGGIVWLFAQLGDKSVKWSASRGAVQKYCRNVTRVWCGFFIINAGMSLATVFRGEAGFWALYNGLVAYILIGCLFAGEFAVRLRVQKKQAECVPLVSMAADSREKDRIVCFSGSFGEGRFKFWGDYLTETAAVRRFIHEREADKIILYAEDFWHFIVGFTAALQCKKDVYVSSNNSSGFIGSLMDENTLYLSEEEAPPAGERWRSACIPRIIRDGGGTSGEELPPIAPTARVYLFTSGSTGEPKEILHEIHELEDDNDSIGVKWRGDFQKRLLVSSVNPHHAFGIVFAMIKPFVHGIPFRRERVVRPDEFSRLGGEKYAFITTPSYLKASAQDPSVAEAKETIGGISVVTAGGVLRREEAEAASAAYGAYPLEIYGSTETGAVAWRVNKGGESEWWTPNEGVRVSLADDGCLVFSGNAIHGDSFHSSDMAELRPDGAFKLLGRKDSVVKIAEKRVSLLEVGNRIIQTGLAKDAAVFALSNEKRQYLAAVAVLSEKGAEASAGMTHASKVKLFRSQLSAYLDPVTIPRRWRFVNALPYNSMGKLQKQEAVALFDTEAEK